MQLPSNGCRRSHPLFVARRSSSSSDVFDIDVVVVSSSSSSGGVVGRGGTLQRYVDEFTCIT